MSGKNNGKMSVEDWERRKSYLIRSLFQDVSALSPVTENESRYEAASPSAGLTSRPYSPLPPLIIERLPNRHDHPEEFYIDLESKMIILYKKEFLGIDTSFYEDFVDYLALSPVTENESRYEAASPSARLTSRPYSPLPPFIIERLPNRHDHPEEFYIDLESKMIILYKKEFLGIDTSFYEDFVDYLGDYGDSHLNSRRNTEQNDVSNESAEATGRIPEPLSELELMRRQRLSFSSPSLESLPSVRFPNTRDSRQNIKRTRSGDMGMQTSSPKASKIAKL